MGERLPCTQEVVSSSLIVSSLGTRYERYQVLEESDELKAIARDNIPSFYAGKQRLYCTLKTENRKKPSMKARILRIAIAGIVINSTWYGVRSIWQRSSKEEQRENALAPRAEEGRSKLRKATGRCKQPQEPWVSEWGNPAVQHTVIHI